MDCWEILGIAPKSDKKTIKIAYAKQLKQTRPDEDPSGFQRLHSAYKEALSWEDYYYEDDHSSWGDATTDTTEVSEPVSDEITLASATTESTLSESEDQLEVTLAKPSDHSEAELIESTLQQLHIDTVEAAPAEVLSKEDLQLLDDIRDQEHALSDSWESFRQQVNTLVTDSKACNKISNWSFLDEMPAMRDLEFRKSAADSLFEVVSELNEESLNKKNLYIKRPVINHLNKLFNWDKHWQEYEYRYSSSMLEAVYPYLEETEKVVKGTNTSRELYYYRRITAFAIDVSILAGSGFVLHELGNYISGAEEGFLWALCWALFYLLILTPLQESSHYQATVGKRVMGLQVINNNGERINFFHAFGRSLATVLCCFMFKIIIWVNIVLSWWKNALLQDLLSRSYVCLKPQRD